MRLVMLARLFWASLMWLAWLMRLVCETASLLLLLPSSDVRPCIAAALGVTGREGLGRARTACDAARR